VNGEIPLVIEVNKADHMARLLYLKRQVETRIIRRIRVVFHGAAESHLLAEELAEAEVGVIVAPFRSFPYDNDMARALPGIPLTKETVISALWKAGVVS
jgi:hypothetical protein